MILRILEISEAFKALVDHNLLNLYNSSHRQASHSPWKSLNFLEFSKKNSRPWNSLKIAISSEKSLNFGANFIYPTQRKRSKHEKTFRIKLLMLWKNSRSFLHWIESLKNARCVLESPWKVLEYEPCIDICTFQINIIKFLLLLNLNSNI